jgi:hypothetical protein
LDDKAIPRAPAVSFLIFCSARRIASNIAKLPELLARRALSVSGQTASSVLASIPFADGWSSMICRFAGPDLFVQYWESLRDTLQRLERAFGPSDNWK